MDVLSFTRELAVEASVLLRERYADRHLGEVHQKGTFSDVVSDVDYEVEALLLKRIRQAFPEHSILSEEDGLTDRGHSHQWVLDPIDGTRNFVHNYPCFGVSLALLVDGKPDVGVIALPVLNEIYSAKRGQGAFLNGQRTWVSKKSEFQRGLFATGFACLRAEADPNNIPATAAILQATHDVRRSGSATTDLCHVASGRTDGFWEMNLSAWDVAAGVLLVEEAGGKVTDFSGGSLDLHSGEIVATNGLLHESLRNVVGPLCRGETG
jgi:myo-inositol-1(or 4)-monophosphatase